MAAVARGAINRSRWGHRYGRRPSMTPVTDIDEDGERLRLTRSGLLRGAAVSVVALSASGGAALSSSRARAAAPPKGTVTRYPLHLPPTTAPASLTLAEAPAVVDLGGGSHSNVWAYNGFFPGPSIVARSGDTASIHLVNGLSEETITHWHGMIVDERNDGGPRYAIAPGASYDYAFTINQRACLNWYHPHPHMLTGEQVNLGLAGAFIVRDSVEDALGLPFGAHEVPLIIRDATLDSAGNLQYKPRSGGFDGQIPLVNGTRNPYLAVDQSVYRFRVLNGANARIFGLALSSGAPFTLIGNDGGLLEFRVVAPGTGSVPTLSLPTITKLSNPVTTRTFSFDGMSKINGKLFDLNRIDFQVPFGQTERWRFITNGNAPHPVHIHGASFQVQSRTGGRGQVFPWERGWKDTVLLEDRETVEVLIRFDAFRGKYLIHCHKLEHEDMGMMSNFEVV